jgi:hypothetical protein
MKYWILASLALFGSLSFSGQIENVFFPDQVTVSGTQLKLNGMGLRKATIFKVKVYAAGLYVSETSQKPELLLESKSPKVLVMKFMREVSQEKINDAWDKAFEETKSQFSKEVSDLKNLMPNAKEGDTFEYVFTEEKTDLKINNALKGSLPGGNWGKALLSTWLGKNPPTEDLKNGLLNIKD